MSTLVTKHPHILHLRKTHDGWGYSIILLRRFGCRDTTTSTSHVRSEDASLVFHPQRFIAPRGPNKSKNTFTIIIIMAHLSSSLHPNKVSSSAIIVKVIVEPDAPVLWISLGGLLSKTQPLLHSVCISSMIFTNLLFIITFKSEVANFLQLNWTSPSHFAPI